METPASDEQHPCVSFHVFPGARFVATIAGRRWRSPTHYRWASLSTDYGSDYGHVPPPDPVLGVSVLFQSLLGRTSNDAPIVSGGDTTITTDPMPIILGTSQALVTSDANGLASMQPSTGGFLGCLGNSGHSHGRIRESAISVAIALADDGLMTD